MTTWPWIRTHNTGSFLNGVRVIELADELGEYCGKVLAGLGADVIKIEPLGGEKTRGYGPFYNDDPHPNRSLHFWHYNFGKRGIVIDLKSAEGADQFMELARTADVIIDTRARDYLDRRGIGYDVLREHNPSLIYARIRAFGDEGPWADYQASDLVHLALGGVMMNCGYDPDPAGFYETPPIAPQMWHAYHIAGEVTAVQIIAALTYESKPGGASDWPRRSTMRSPRIPKRTYRTGSIVVSRTTGRPAGIHSPRPVRQCRAWPQTLRCGPVFQGPRTAVGCWLTVPILWEALLPSTPP